MPVYEYTCKACDHEFEREQRISDAPLKTCPSCGARKAKRMISRTSFVLKGGGWYADLYSSPGDKGAEKKQDGGEKKDKGGGEPKSKPEKASSASGGEKPKGPKGAKGAQAAA